MPNVNYCPFLYPQIVNSPAGLRHTPATPASMHPMTPTSLPMSSGVGSSGTTTSTADSLSHHDLPSDLNFDPAAVIDGEGNGQESLDVSIVLTMNFFNDLSQRVRN